MAFHLHTHYHWSCLDAATPVAEPTQAIWTVPSTSQFSVHYPSRCSVRVSTTTYAPSNAAQYETVSRTYHDFSRHTTLPQKHQAYQEQRDRVRECTFKPVHPLIDRTFPATQDYQAWTSLDHDEPRFTTRIVVPDYVPQHKEYSRSMQRVRAEPAQAQHVPSHHSRSSIFPETIVVPSRNQLRSPSPVQPLRAVNRRPAAAVREHGAVGRILHRVLDRSERKSKDNRSSLPRSSSSSDTRTLRAKSGRATRVRQGHETRHIHVGEAHPTWASHSSDWEELGQSTFEPTEQATLVPEDSDSHTSDLDEEVELLDVAGETTQIRQAQENIRQTQARLSAQQHRLQAETARLSEHFANMTRQQHRLQEEWSRLRSEQRTMQDSRNNSSDGQSNFDSRRRNADPSVSSHFNSFPHFDEVHEPSLFRTVFAGLHADATPRPGFGFPIHHEMPAFGAFSGFGDFGNAERHFADLFADLDEENDFSPFFSAPRPPSPPPPPPPPRSSFEAGSSSRRRRPRYPMQHPANGHAPLQPQGATTAPSGAEARASYERYTDRWAALSSADTDIAYPTTSLRCAPLLDPSTVPAGPVSTTPPSEWSSEKIMQANVMSFFLLAAGLRPRFVNGENGKMRVEFRSEGSVGGWGERDGVEVERVRGVVEVLKKERVRWHSDRLARRSGELASDERARAVFHGVCELLATCEDWIRER
ncbi:hypothetical protein LTR66_010547 [Elasticomyces elasticus]|nr:hypothetical protein LTR66_010547 [Elasticomyces elasticus]KAK5011374.1 hypothetical protein LTR28_003612 [Elasticomyces elasticus]